MDTDDADTAYARAYLVSMTVLERKTAEQDPERLFNCLCALKKDIEIQLSFRKAEMCVQMTKEEFFRKNAEYMGWKARANCMKSKCELCISKVKALRNNARDEARTGNLFQAVRRHRDKMIELDLDPEEHDLELYKEAGIFL